MVTAGVTMFSPANTSKELSDYDDKGLYFRNAPSDILQGGVLAEVIAEDGALQRSPSSTSTTRYGNGLAEDLTASFEEGGGEVLATVPYAPDSQTFESEVNEIVGTDADAIVVVGFEESARIVAELIKQSFGPRRCRSTAPTATWATPPARSSRPPTSSLRVGSTDTGCGPAPAGPHPRPGRVERVPGVRTAIGIRRTRRSAGAPRRPDAGSGRAARQAGVRSPGRGCRGTAR